ncbi:CcoQ/FixQ family Cbb3-type cytochrome c oxidase assembly chaperone [Piscinibacter sp. HJYY11]|uniref:cbb3-type cytochrome oxidase subunit 3 n=1 Tax=Piscinibacter sp. HJYY11 TaxID=2801333 RepID=UPI00191EC4C3|nr:CcoQ/FixQ family Cbb3-type cytochrome c oxidase assembly chaperone [Piscinibacter sp. HJYY11]MBL0726410.1 CcoQ/FixQ family Cbb3-type cytochrome c oxidase assembly chaperone [Piscinibacter sp. HJYY11]
MDLNDLRSLVTLVSLATFAGICTWAWARRNRDRFDEAALVPFMADADDAAMGARHE